MVAAPIAQRLVLLPSIAVSYGINPENRPAKAASAEAREGPKVLRREELRRLVREGDVEARYQLATAHYRGIDGPVDPITAAEWYRKAAARNHGRAQVKLGLMHEEGRGVPKDVVHAYMWYTLALNNGLRWVEPAYREKLVTTMTADQISRAEELAWKWLQEHPIEAAGGSN
jgi:TPR repeat protein